MGDMGDLFNDLKDIKRSRAQTRKEEFLERREALADMIREAVSSNGRYQVYFNTDDSGTWNIKIYGPTARAKGATIQYYPTKGTWQVKGRMWHGGLDSFQNWILKRLPQVLI